MLSPVKAPLIVRDPLFSTALVSFVSIGLPASSLPLMILLVPVVFTKPFPKEPAFSEVTSAFSMVVPPVWVFSLEIVTSSVIFILTGVPVISVISVVTSSLVLISTVDFLTNVPLMEMFCIAVSLDTVKPEAAQIRSSTPEIPSAAFLYDSSKTPVVVATVMLSEVLAVVIPARYASEKYRFQAEPVPISKLAVPPVVSTLNVSRPCFSVGVPTNILTEPPVALRLSSVALPFT